MLVGKYVANRSVAAQAARFYTLSTRLYDYFYPNGGLRRSAPVIWTRKIYYYRETHPLKEKSTI